MQSCRLKSGQAHVHTGRNVLCARDVRHIHKPSEVLLPLKTRKPAPMECHWGENTLTQQKTLRNKCDVVINVKCMAC